MKKLISKETIAEVNNMIKSPDATFDACDIYGDFKVRLGNVVVHKAGSSSVIELDTGVNKEMFAQWKRDVGRFLSRDLSHGIYNNLFELKADGKRALLRKIQQKELPDMRAEGFDHVYIGDYHYTIIRVIPNTGRYSDPDENTDSDDCTQYSYISEFDKNDAATEEEQAQQGMQLFNEDDVTSFGFDENDGYDNDND